MDVVSRSRFDTRPTIRSFRHWSSIHAGQFVKEKRRLTQPANTKKKKKKKMLLLFLIRLSKNDDGDSVLKWSPGI